MAIASPRSAARPAPPKRDIDADGMLVTPGWVDVHTHYDGQATWDQELAPSSWHGVTTILFGNCGVGFAPVRREHHASLIGLMEAVEEIPGITLSEGLKWDWESFPQYLDALDRMPRAIDVAAQVPHHPLRVYVMGERAINREPATAEDIEAMRRMTREALEAGAFGFTTSRTNSHKTPTGEMVPGRYSEVQELLGIGSALKGLKHGAFGVNSDFDDRDRGTRLDDETGPGHRPPGLVPADRPSHRSGALAAADAGRAHRPRAGRPVTAQVAGRPVGIMLGVDTALNPFTIRPSYQELLTLPAAERLKRLTGWPIRHLLRRQRNVTVAMAEVPGVDAANRSVLVHYLGRPDTPFEYDYLILATGASQSYFGHNEFAPFAPA